MKKKFNPRTEAIAFRIWAFAKQLGWDCTLEEVALAIDEDINVVKGILTRKGWHARLRKSKKNLAPDGILKSNGFKAVSYLIDGDRDYAEFQKYADTSDDTPALGALSPYTQVT